MPAGDMMKRMTAEGGAAGMKKLKTRWTDQVLERPDQVLAEYPRPSMRRESYVNLNGYWDYVITGREKTGAVRGEDPCAIFTGGAPVGRGEEPSSEPGAVVQAVTAGSGAQETGEAMAPPLRGCGPVRRCVCQ